MTFWLSMVASESQGGQADGDKVMRVLKLDGVKVWKIRFK